MLVYRGLLVADGVAIGRPHRMFPYWTGDRLMTRIAGSERMITELAPGETHFVNGND